MEAGALRCEGCGRRRPGHERFCPACGLPLVHDEDPLGEVSERHARARKVKGQYAEGRLVRAASAQNQAEAELIAGLLLEEGVPSVVQRSGGFDVPDFLAAGPRDVLVAESGADVAREVLASVAPAPGAPRAPREGTPVWVQAMAVTMVAVVLATVAVGVALAVW